MQRVDVHPVEATHVCDPRHPPRYRINDWEQRTGGALKSCGALVPIGRLYCPECDCRQQRPSAPEPTGELLSNCVLYDGDRPILLAATVSREAAGFVTKIGDKFAPRKTWGKPRLSGLGDRQVMFGTIQPQPIRRRYGCRRSKVTMATDTGRWQAIAEECHSILEQHLPAQAAANVAAAEPIHAPWKWAGTGWTSGVVNYTQHLAYHQDAGNLSGSWSAMIGARSGVTGGHLHLPEYGVTIEVGHRSLICFPGGEIVHGVTPMRVGRLGWRVTAVFYGLRACKHCAPTEREEIARAAKYATERARVVAAGHYTPGDPNA